jgi:hypothetical protein
MKLETERMSDNGLLLTMTNGTRVTLVDDGSGLILLQPEKNEERYSIRCYRVAFENGLISKVEPWGFGTRTEEAAGLAVQA